MQNLFSEGGIKSRNILSFSPAETVEICKNGAVLIDVREEYLSGFKMFGVPEVVYLPWSRLEKEFSVLSKERFHICADSSGVYSKQAVVFLLQHGFDKAANLAGGMIEWERDKMPIELDKGERLTGSCMCQLKPREHKKKS